MAGIDSESWREKREEGERRKASESDSTRKRAHRRCGEKERCATKVREKGETICTCHRLGVGHVSNTHSQGGEIIVLLFLMVSHLLLIILNFNVIFPLDTNAVI